MLSDDGLCTQHVQDVLLILVLVVNSDWFGVTCSYSIAAGSYVLLLHSQVTTFCCLQHKIVQIGGEPGYTCTDLLLLPQS